ncbi:DUF2219 family protein [Pricia sp. S334]|uniref:DUF2219 family protein n=1 Tax=Pricia mediterranea TaxID=3076079 RepID=A0ABU3L379_9FLAO|nr:lipid A-modifier LpxR family protein [Pricia sp. S334]MDT7827547.1 DUF2219 family protein [Pricia sp. S334]
MEADRIAFDRPYAGLLYGRFETVYTFNRSFLKGTLLLGIMGPASLAGKFQDWFHDEITHDPIFDEWKYQVPNQSIFNADLTYGYDFLPNRKWFDVYSAINARLGNLYIDASPTLGVRFGKFNKLAHSLATDNAILLNPADWELLVQATIGGSVNLFDGTAQGSLFRRDFEYAVDDLKLFNAVTTLSLYATFKRISLGIEHHFLYGKVVPTERHVYARTIFKYRF